jgi:hypothetical protein
MKRNTIILISLFALLLIVAFLVLQKPGEQSVGSASSGFMFAIDSVSVDKIEIKTAASSVVLEKRGAEWFVAQPINYRADQVNVGEVIHQVKNLEVKSTVSDKPEKHPIFQLDASGTQVAVFEKGSAKASFILGKMGPSYTETYIRKSNANEVLLTEGISNYMFNRQVKEWRDKTIFSTPKESIKEVQYQYGDTIFALSFNDSLWVIGKDKARQSVVDGILASLSNLQAADFIDSTIAPKLTATVACSGIQLRFSFDKAANKYQVQSSNSPQWFIVDQWKANQILKRKKEIAETGKK